MHARVTQFRIRAGKLEEFTAAIGSLIPVIQKQPGFRALLVLRSEPGDAPEARVISTWDSLDDLRASEKNMFFYQAVARLLDCCEGFPVMREEEVLVSEFAPH